MIEQDSNLILHSFVRGVDDKNCVRAMSEQIIRFGNDLRITDDLNEHTLSLAFDFFDMYVTIKAMKDCVETYLLLHGG